MVRVSRNACKTLKTRAPRTINIQHNIFAKFRFRNYILCYSKQSESPPDYFTGNKVSENQEKLDLKGYKKY